MSTFKDRIHAIVCDRDHGSSNLLRRIVDTLDGSKVPLPDEAQQRWALAELRRIDPSMVLIHHLLYSLGHEPGGDLAERVRAYARQWSDIPARVAEKLRAAQSWDGARVLLHSHSGMVVSAVEIIHRQSRGMRFWQTRSLPGGEGVLQHRHLRQHRIPCGLLEDDQVAVMAGSMDMAWLGADQFTAGHFVNKVGSAVIARAMQEAGKPLFVLADSRKQVQQLNYTDELFEAVPFTENVWLVTEIGVLPGASLPDEFFVTSQTPPV